MDYMYYFEVAAVANLVIILYDMLTKKQYYRDDAKIFIRAALSQTVLSLVDILSCLLLENTETVPLFLNKIVVVVYFILQATTIFFITLFPQAYNCHKTIRASRQYVGAWILYAANMLIALTSAFNGLYFYFDGTRHYHQGSLAGLGYAFYLIMALIIIIYALMPNHKYLVRERLALVVSMLLICAGVWIQYAMRNVLSLGLSTSIALLLIYVTLENPNNYMDKTLGIGNHEAMKRRMETWNPIRDTYVFVTVRVDNLSHFEHLTDGDKSEEIISMLVDFMMQNTDSERNVYRLDDNSITVVIRGNREKAGEFTQGLKVLDEQSVTDRNGEKYNLEYSIAACVYPDQVNSFHKFHSATDYLLGAVRGNAGTHVAIADGDTMEKLERRERVEKVLSRALKSDSVDLFFQPIYDTKAGKITGLEALSRLTDPEMGNIKPSEFIEIAEADGRIVELTQKQFEKICRFINKNIKNTESTIENINVNLSPVLLNRSEMVPWLINMMQKYDIPVGMINFEITESATADSPEILAIAIKQLMDAGAVFSLDDYGTGYSNILYMANFPFVAIKFDRELIWSYFEQDVFRTILNKEFELVSELKENIVAEGVETEEQLNTLIKKGIRYIQGYYFSSPLSEERIMEYLMAPAPAKWFR